MTEFVVAVCTAQRPEMLRRCLESLVQLTAPTDARIQIIVVENALTPDSAEIVSSIQQKSPIEIHYRLEQRSGIPFARNAALDLATALGADWIALIDDDEYAEPDWLIKLYEGSVTFGADVASGPVDQICVGEPPDWWTPRIRPCRPTGKILRGAATNNILMRAHLVRKDGLALRFDERLLGGSEDVEFFRRATDNGAKIIWVAEARLCEELPASRLSVKKRISRTYMVATSQAQVLRIQRGAVRGFLTLLPKIMRGLIIGSSALLFSAIVWIVRPIAGKSLFYSGALRIVKAAGQILGGFGFYSAYYRTIDGR
ncbi:glycosyltransferase family 2 protein [Hyphomicrobium sp.]|uniref:glycosyltransferase family 2 protein n=1 Tax=Hyphomicrobium sp. TaxID=82 RepID=UPI001D8B6BF5|nr:glycosyltransferase family A protein [Hyphomicrobium sp.]MBY0559355.1 glycosyltransferase family 2 protein [Hyphomicrobium sp.]